MEERIQKLIAAAGLCSRRTAEEWIQAGRVSVNGKPACLGMKASKENDVIAVDGKDISFSDEKLYVMLHKPRGYVTTLSDEKGRHTVAELVSDCGARVYPVGRLDYNSEGLLLFTNDGALTQRLLHPSFEVDKTYQVDVKGDVQDGIKVLRSLRNLDGETIAEAKVELLRERKTSATLSITIHEGKNRQIRRMCAAAGLTVQRLVRIAEHGLFLGELPSGTWRYLSEKELRQLFS